MSHLFSPASIGQVSLKNRIIVPPMCQYSAENGMPTAWHKAHYMNLALSGASLVIVEASAVVPEGRITYKDLGLWNEEQMTAMQQMLSDIRQYSDARLGVQIAHAGRKASTDLPWLGGNSIQSTQPNGWQTVAPSALAFGNNAIPHALTIEEISQLKQQFIEAAIRAEKAGFDVIEIHAAHGYILHEFLSPVSNLRQDEYGGCFKNRTRLLINIFHEMREAISPNVAIGVRISATDWLESGWSVPESIELTELLEDLGCDYIHVSSGGLSTEQQIPLSPNYQVPLAQAIHENTMMPVIAVGLITEPLQAEAIVATHQADFVAIGRGILFEPRWPWRAASELNEQIDVAPQYLRSAPHQFKHLFK
ncbi:NADH:flavin oxidoreductase/NADH oxidase [Providencia hangzhouensis]|uniref:NADH:flavin oxidoreductase/NADH oxidase n=3 Tax=Providencia TaxID=586 RepID=A0A264VVA7_PRORE|nr:MULTISPECIES: NADH:flavin oxidoreductase/NADH oxidase [Providencia]MRF66468.1 oxidoreductase [Escherichia coli]EFE55091.1 oxidoreductase, FAD/FMN-binding protein [Providencia rettgeri DSM 1131]MBG5891630.1 NADH:flavin oxidoreductase/NADH oxidase [Providencia rettgeri]MBI6188404.1 NADH:flavin oxidoreductase/NADH oxidase [Providencia rettgeri]MBN6367590.1 NADH:flavin oxidoreductase/NADH oxidase [Providencia rettgeri]